MNALRIGMRAPANERNYRPFPILRFERPSKEDLRGNNGLLFYRSASLLNASEKGKDKGGPKDLLTHEGSRTR